jgi:hypothetical protein
LDTERDTGVTAFAGFAEPSLPPPGTCTWTHRQAKPAARRNIDKRVS